MMCVRAFMRKHHQDTPFKPSIPVEATVALRKSLIEEEVNKELIPAMDKGDLYEIADALADTLYVVFGTALAYGIPMDSIFDEVHRSNMSKEAIKRTKEEVKAHKVEKGYMFSKPRIKMLIDAAIRFTETGEPGER
jgi:predicted HAD superfamily Cof-like phosphohydrolase